VTNERSSRHSYNPSAARLESLLLSTTKAISRKQSRKDTFLWLCHSRRSRWFSRFSTLRGPSLGTLNARDIRGVLREVSICGRGQPLFAFSECTSIRQSSGQNVVVASEGRRTAGRAWRQVPDVALLDLPLTTLREHNTWNWRVARIRLFTSCGECRENGDLVRVRKS